MIREKTGCSKHSSQFQPLVGLLALMMLILATTSAAPSIAQQDQPLAERQFVPGEILVGFKAEAIPILAGRKVAPLNTGLEALDTLNAAYGVREMMPIFPGVNPKEEPVARYGMAGIYKLVVAEDADIVTMVRAYQAHPLVEFAELNPIYRISDIECPGRWKGEYFNNRTLSGGASVIRCDDRIDFTWGVGSPAGVIPSDNFSARWTGTYHFDGGRYRFNVFVDDGIRLWVDGNLILDEWHDAVASYSREVDLATGNHSLRVEYFEHGGSAAVRLSWERLAGSTGCSGRWQGEYYANRELRGSPSVVRCDDAINFNWGGGSPAAGVPTDNFSARWTGTFNFRQGWHRLSVFVDDGIRVWVDGNMVLDEWRDQVASFSRDLNLSGGDHAVRVEYFEHGGGAAVRVLWEYASDLPNDSGFRDQWALHNTGQTGGKPDADIDAPEAWAIERGRPEVLIAVVDTGVNYRHPDLAGKVRTDIDKDYIQKDDDADDDHGHGTHVAGVIAAYTGNGIGIAGICQNCQVLPLKVCDSSGGCPGSDVADAVRYAADKGARVISMSLGMHPNCGCSETMARAINYAWDKGSLLIAAAGNDSQDRTSYPSSSPRVMSVGASDHNDALASFSNHGGDMDIVAPGIFILSTILGDRYDRWSGTSMATPHASGVAGLLFSHNPNLTNAEAWWILQRSADDLGSAGYDSTFGWGRLNAARALGRAVEGRVDASVDACSGEPSNCGCSIGAALWDDPERESHLSALRAFRNQVLTQSEAGRRWERLFYRHTLEVSALLLADSELRAQAAKVVKEFTPAIQVLLEGDSKAAAGSILTKAQVEQLEGMLLDLAERGSPGLRTDILTELNRVNPRRFVGQDIRKIWKTIEQER